MLRPLILFGFALSVAASSSATDTPSTLRNLTAAEIVTRNVAARGGLQAWRAVQSISETGRLGAGGNRREAVSPPPPAGVKRPPKENIPESPRLNEEAQLPFVLDLERPRKLRFEIQFKGQTAVQVYDGTSGWKLRPYLNRAEVEPYTSDELKLAAMESELDGPLVDYAAKGTTIEFAGTEKVDNRNTYKLKLIMKDGRSQHVWIDAETFLEMKVEGQPRRLDGKMHPVEVYYRDYRDVNGVKIPFVLQTKVLAAGDEPANNARNQYPPETITIEKVTLNPRLDASLFGKPATGAATASR